MSTKGSLIFLSPTAVHHVYTTCDSDIVLNILLKKEYVEKTFVNMVADNKLFFNFFLSFIRKEKNRQIHCL